MPMALLSVVLMPFGLEDVPLRIMGEGLRVVMVISDWIASWPNAGFSVPLVPAPASVLLSLGTAFVAIPRSSLRWLSVPALVAGLVMAVWDHPADLLVEERAATIAAVNAEGRLVPLPDGKARYAVSHWLTARGDREMVTAATQGPLWTCTPSYCQAEVRGRRVVFLKSTAEPLKPCPAADVVVAQYPLRRSCKGKLATIDRFDVWRRGAHAIRLDQAGANVTTARGVQGERLWSVVPRPRLAGQK